MIYTPQQMLLWNMVNHTYELNLLTMVEEVASLR